MGKNDFLTPKAIANRIKSKGLQKLRWYCQMCQKQCRDENGFKCHLTSESHKRQMMVFGENPDRVIDGYSEEFEATFLEHLRRNHPSSRVSAQNVYNEYIADKHHIHMNSTRWLTLTEFVKYLGRTGKCKVDQTEKGWFIVFQKRDIDEELQEQRAAKRHKAEKEEEDRQREALQAQIERARAAAAADEAAAGPQASELRRDPEAAAAPVQLALPKPRLAERSRLSAAAPVAREAPQAFRDDGGAGAGDAGAGAAGGSSAARPRSKQEEIMAREQAAKKAAAERTAAEAKARGRQDAPWLLEGIVVKVLSKELRALGYYKEKGAVEKLFSPYVAQIEMLKSGDVLQVDQAQLETVLPSPGGQVLLLRAPHRGARAVLQQIDTAKFQAEVALPSGERLWLEYEELSKAADKA